MSYFFNEIKNIFTYKNQVHHKFNYQDDFVENQKISTSDSSIVSKQDFSAKKLFADLKQNKAFIKNQYNAEICSDIIVRDFSVLVQDTRYNAFVIFIDGMVDSNLINNFILNPLMMRNIANSYSESNYDVSATQNNKNTPSSVLGDYIYSNLIPQNSVQKVENFSDIFAAINMGDCVLFVDSLKIAYDVDVKGFKQRSIDTPNNEVVVRGSQECFVENLRTNTSILRRLINNENLVLEKNTIGKVTKTKVAIGYINGIVNQELVSEVRYRISNLDIDYLTSSGQLEQLIQDNPNSIFPQIVATERPDKVVNYLLDGRVCLIVNGSPYALVMPGVFVDFLSSPEDLNLKYQFANLSKIIRLFSLLVSILLPGLYIAVTNYHQELIPTELLFTIAASRESVPFPTVIEILLMEISFELIREAGLRVPAPLGSTIGIVGAIILGDAAVSASLVSPILIIIVAITGICSFSIPDFSLDFTCRIYRFTYIILGYMAGFLGIGVGIFIQLTQMCNLKTFGSSYLDPLPLNKKSISSYFVLPIWKREQISKFVHPSKKDSQGKISMKWRYK